jgi:ATP-dependent Clp protease ATP-binding subunit ClpC
LFDEIEKAHPEVWNALLQILDDGRLTDGQGHIVDFRNTVLIMTSNLGTKFVSKSGPVGYHLPNVEPEDREAQRNIQKELKTTFRPEFINRIDEIITFSSLSLDDMTKIVDLQMADVRERLSEHSLMVEITEATRKWLAEIGYDPDFGARPLQRALQKHLESPLSVKLLSGEFTSGDTVIVDVSEDEVELVFMHKSQQKKKSIQEEVEVDA